MRTDSDSENDMAAEEKRSHAGHGRTLLKRVFSAKKTSWPGWWYEAAGLLETAGLEQYMSGSNRSKQDSTDESESRKYKKYNQKLFNHIYGAISTKTTAGKALRLQIQDEFGHERGSRPPPLQRSNASSRGSTESTTACSATA